MNERRETHFFPPKKDADAFRRILNERRRNFFVPLELEVMNKKMTENWSISIENLWLKLSRLC